MGLHGNAPWSSSAEAWQPYIDGHQSRPPDLCFPPCRRRRRARSLGLGTQRVPRSDKLNKSHAALSATARRWTSPRRTGAPHPRPATNGCRPATARRAARPTAPPGLSTKDRRSNNAALAESSASLPGQGSPQSRRGRGDGGREVPAHELPVQKSSLRAGVDPWGIQRKAGRPRRLSPRRPSSPSLSRSRETHRRSRRTPAHLPPLRALRFCGEIPPHPSSPTGEPRRLLRAGQAIARSHRSAPTELRARRSGLARAACRPAACTATRHHR